MKYKRVAATFASDKRVRQYAADLGDSRLLTKLAGCDRVATEAEYHANCLTSFYKLHLKYVERSSQTTTSNHIHGIVFAEVDISKKLVMTTINQCLSWQIWSSCIITDCGNWANMIKCIPHG